MQLALNHDIIMSYHIGLAVFLLFKKFGLVTLVMNGEFNSQNVRKSTRILYLFYFIGK